MGYYIEAAKGKTERLLSEYRAREVPLKEERDVEKRVCRVLWEAFNDFFDATSDREDIRLLDKLRDNLVEVMPYTPEEARGD
jgi:hypothetical protein